MATQTERRAATRRALLDAARAVLVEHGVQATTTAEIAERAGYSHGALFRHFATKGDLLIGVLEDVYPRLVEQYVTAFADALAADEFDVVDHVLAPLLDVMRSPTTRAGLELLTAARTDPDLAERATDMEARYRAAMRDAGRPLLRSVTRADVDDAQVDAAIDLAIDLCIGIAVSTAVADGERVPAELDLAGRLLGALLLP